MEINTSDCREEKKNSLHFVTLSFLKQETCYTLAGNIPVDKRFEFSPSCIQNVPLISYCMFKCAYISKLNMSFTPAKCHSEAVTLQTLRKKEEKKKLLQQSSCLLTVILNFGNCKRGREMCLVQLLLVTRCSLSGSRHGCHCGSILCCCVCVSKAFSSEPCDSEDV